MTEQRRRNWDALAMMFWLLAMVPAMPVFIVYLAGRPREEDAPDQWPFLLAGGLLLLVALYFTYRAWRGRSPLTFHERQVIEEALRGYDSSLTVMNDMYEKSIASSGPLVAKGAVQQGVIDELQMDIDDNRRTQERVRSALTKVDQLL